MIRIKPSPQEIRPCGDPRPLVAISGLFPDWRFMSALPPSQAIEAKIVVQIFPGILIQTSRMTFEFAGIET